MKNILSIHFVFQSFRFILFLSTFYSVAQTSIVGEEDLEISTVSTDLPVVYITTENQELINSTDVYVLGTVTVESGFSVKGDSLLSGLDSLSMKIRGRGNSTWVTHPKNLIK